MVTTVDIEVDILIRQTHRRAVPSDHDKPLSGQRPVAVQSTDQRSPKHPPQWTNIINHHNPSVPILHYSEIVLDSPSSQTFVDDDGRYLG
jgi:hypothetical protein